MSLKLKTGKTQKTGQGFDLTETHATIKSVSIDKLNRFITIQVAVFKDKAARDNRNQPVRIQSHYVNDDFDAFYENELTKGNIIKNAYEYIMTLPEFTDFETDEK